jgi:hypothetical protein
MQHFGNIAGSKNTWTTPRIEARPLAYPTVSKCLHITIYDGSESPMIFLRKLEALSGHIHRVAMQVRGKPFSGDCQKTAYSVVVFLLKVEFLTAEAARKALASLMSRDSSLGLAETARKVLASALPAFALDEEDVLVDIRSFHDTVGVMRHGTPSLHSEPLVQQDYANEQRIPSSKRILLSPLSISRSYRVSYNVSAHDQAAGTTNPSSRGVLLSHKSIEIEETTRPRSCGSEGGSYSSSSAPSAGSNTSARNGSYIRHDDAVSSFNKCSLDLEYEATTPMSLQMADISDDYEDLALEISKFHLITPTNDRGDAPWRHYGPSTHWGLLTSASASKGDAGPQSYLHPRETYGLSQTHNGNVSPSIHRPGMSLDDCTPKTSPLSQSFGVAIDSPGNLQRSTSSSTFERQMRVDTPQNSRYRHNRTVSTAQKPQHTRGSSYSSIATSQSHHSDYQSYDSKSTSSHSSTSTPAKRSNKKSSQDKRLYVTDPHKGPRPTDWMLSEETLKSRAARDARFMQIVATGLAPGRTKAGWTQARRPGKRDRDAAKAKMREMEEEKERERLRQLLGEDARPSASAASVAC